MIGFCTWLYAGPRMRVRSVALGFLASALIAACGGGSPPTTAPQGRGEFGRDASDLRPVPPSRIPSVKRTRPIIPAPLTSVAGLTEDEVRRIVGEPQERAEIDGRRTWIYRGAGCRVEITFFRDVTRGVFAALAHKVVRPGADGARSPQATCERGLVSAAGR